SDPDCRLRAAAHADPYGGKGDVGFLQRNHALRAGARSIPASHAVVSAFPGEPREAASGDRLERFRLPHCGYRRARPRRFSLRPRPGRELQYLPVRLHFYIDWDVELTHPGAKERIEP